TPGRSTQKIFATASATIETAITMGSRKGMSKKLVTKKRQAWGEQQGTEQFKGLPLAYPHSVAVKYREAMTKLIDPMIREYQRALDPHVAADMSLTTTLTRLLSDLGKKWSRRFGEESSRVVN